MRKCQVQRANLNDTWPFPTISQGEHLAFILFIAFILCKKERASKDMDVVLWPLPVAPIQISQVSVLLWFFWAAPMSPQTPNSPLSASLRNFSLMEEKTVSATLTNRKLPWERSSLWPPCRASHVVSGKELERYTLKKKDSQDTWVLSSETKGCYMEQGE